MANKCTLAVTEEQYKDIVFFLEHGFNLNGIEHRPNKRVAFAVKLEYVTGMRVSDIVRLKPSDIVRDGNHYRLDIREQKTGKKRTFRISEAVHDCIQAYCRENGISMDNPIIGGSTYGIQRRLKDVGDYLGLQRFSTHSLRKAASWKVYNGTGKDIVAVQTFLNHSSPSVSARYLNSSSTALDKVLDALVM